MTVPALDTLGAAVASLTQVFDGPKALAALTAEEVAKEATRLGFPDKDLAVDVWRHLTRQEAETLKNVADRKVTEEKISKALFFILLDPEATPSGRNKKARDLSKSFRAVLREMAQRLGVALNDIAALVEETGMGYSPHLSELASEFAAFLKTARHRVEARDA